jgi:ABC-type transport system involved in multi-copper enzyme maturation permease subunit
MFRTILSKEIRNHLMTFRFAAALVTMFVLVIISLWVLGNDYLRRRDAYNLAAEETARQDREVYVPSQVSPTLHRPPSILSIFVQGEDRRFGNSVQVLRWEVPRRADGSFTDNMLMAALPALDLHTIFEIVASLFGILFCYDAICGERENGTLKLQCTGSAGRGAIYSAKFLGATVCLAIPILISLTAGLLLLLFFFNLSFSAEQWLAVAGIGLAGIAYSSLFAALGLACSALVRRSSVALILALFIWTMAVLVIPSAAQSTAEYLVPLPSSSKISNEEKASEREAVAKVQEFSQVHPGYWWGNWTSSWSVPGDGGYVKFDSGAQYFRDSIEFVRFIEPLMLSRASSIWDAYNKQFEDFKSEWRIAEAISFISPAHHLRKALTSLANTGYAVYGDFMESVRRFRRQMITGFERRGYFTDNALGFFCRRPASEITDERYMQRQKYYGEQAEAGKRYEEFMGPHLWGPLPEDETPHYEYIADKPDFAAAAQPCLFLIIYLAIVFSVGFAAFLRYDVR